MKFKELCWACNNLTPTARVKVITPGKEPYVGMLDDIFMILLIDLLSGSLLETT